MDTFSKSFQIHKDDFIKAGEASIKVKNLLKKLSLDPGVVRRVAVCGYEGEMNVVMHGGEGELTLTITNKEIQLELRDDGPGIPDIDKALEKGFSTAAEEYREMGFGAGMGLSNMKNHSDRLFLESMPGPGTRVSMAFDI